MGSKCGMAASDARGLNSEPCLLHLSLAKESHKLALLGGGNWILLGTRLHHGAFLVWQYLFIWHCQRQARKLGHDPGLAIVYVAHRDYRQHAGNPDWRVEEQRPEALADSVGGSCDAGDGGICLVGGEPLGLAEVEVL